MAKEQGKPTGPSGKTKASAPSAKFANRFPGAKPLHGGGDMYQWNEIGQELVGTFLGVKEFRNGHIASLQTEDGRVAFSAPTILADTLKGIRPGSQIAIVYSNERPPTKRGLSGTKEFEVYDLEESTGGGEEEEE